MHTNTGETRHETDHERVFRQESNFSYLFGVKEPDCMAIIEIDTGKTTLLVPKLPEEYAVWMGKIRSNESFKDEYMTDNVEFVEDIKDVLEKVKPSQIHTTRGLNKDSGRYAKEATFEGIDAYTVVNTDLYDEVVECRVIKTEKELNVCRLIEVLLVVGLLHACD
jgi:Xaa-Pro dipeptidase